MDPNGADADGDRQSPRSTKKDSRESLRCPEEESNDEKSITWRSESEQDQLSAVDGRRGSASSFYSQEYESPSEGTISPDSQSRIPSISPRRRMQLKTTSSTRVNHKGRFNTSVMRLNGQVAAVWSFKPFNNLFLIVKREPKGSYLLPGYVGRPGAYRQEHSPWQIPSQQHRRNARWQTKEHPPCKELDMATKRLLSSRLLKINELKNAQTELQEQYSKILVENRTLKQVTGVSCIVLFVSSRDHDEDRIDTPHLRPDTGSGTSAAPQRHREPGSPADVTPFQGDPRVPRAAEALSRAGTSTGAQAEGQGGAAAKGAGAGEKEPGHHLAAEAFARSGRPGDQRRAEPKAGERENPRPSGRRENEGESAVKAGLKRMSHDSSINCVCVCV